MLFRLAGIHKIRTTILQAKIYTVYIAGVRTPLLSASPHIYTIYTESLHLQWQNAYTIFTRIYNLLVQIIIYAHQFKAADTDHSDNEYVHRNV